MIRRLPFVSFGGNPGLLQDLLYSMQSCQLLMEELLVSQRILLNQVVQALEHPKASLFSLPQVPHHSFPPEQLHLKDCSSLQLSLLIQFSAGLKSQLWFLLSCSVFHTDAALLAISGEEEAFPWSPTLDCCWCVFLHRWFWQRSDNWKRRPYISVAAV